ncbi:Fungalysin metallopeptidase-domain-containing protein [Pisolithus marmoratus]|nr:Fungalysin metallopeptidase-domain-containing protein [Pisolithus marmoratus]
MDPRRALLEFMVAALPRSHPAFEGVLGNPEQHIQDIKMTPETQLLHFLGFQEQSGMSRPVSLHGFEVKMQDNWYEATVTVALPHRIISVVDWASEEQLPPLDAFVPYLSSVGSTPRTKLRPRKAVADLRKGKCKSGSVSMLAPIPKKYPAPPKDEPAQYLVFPWGTNDPEEAAVHRAKAEGTEAHPTSYGRFLVFESVDTLASPPGWHTLPNANNPSADEGSFRRVKAEGEFWRKSNRTWGNNVFAQENWNGRDQWMYNYRPEGSLTDSVLLHDEDSEIQQAQFYTDASVTQLFYISNMFHDLVYRYGFTEEAGNFQQYNFGRGGLENDAVIASAQDGSGINNANFMTPLDGPTWVRLSSVLSFTILLKKTLPDVPLEHCLSIP